MPAITYHVVVTFDRNEDGDLRPGEVALEWADNNSYSKTVTDTFKQTPY